MELASSWKLDDFLDRTATSKWEVLKIYIAARYSAVLVSCLPLTVVRPSLPILARPRETQIA